jgi:polysaccharide pyruvyl transferase WcaK-like protein
MKRIILAGLLTDRNLGDIVIADCAKFLYNEETRQFSDVEYAGIDLAGYNKFIRKKPYIIRKMYGVKYRLFRLLNKDTIIKKREQYSNYYAPQIKDASLVVIVGGGLIKYKYQDFWIWLSGLIDAAGKYNIPVVLNALGVEGYDENNIKCQFLKEALNKPVVSVITTRDEIDTLKNLYLKGNEKIVKRLVADPAVYASSAYNVRKNGQSNIVGVGLIRGTIFMDNNVNFSKEEVVQLYIDVLSELEKRKILWKMFTNGLPADLELAEEIFRGIGKPDEAKNIIVPNTSKELVETISGFKGVIAARLHACIISYSLEIPAIGLIWNDKLSLFGKQIGYPNRFINSTQFDKEYIVNELDKAIAEGYDLEKMETYKRTVKDSIKEILKINSITN